MILAAVNKARRPVHIGVRSITKSVSAEELSRGRVTRQPAIISTQTPDEPTHENSEVTEGKSKAKCKHPFNFLMLALMCTEKLNEGPSAVTSTQQLLTDEVAAKDAYFGSFEQDSFDLDDCFNGSTQPENSDLLKNRMAERKGETTQTNDCRITNSPKISLPKPASPPSRAESEARTMESVASSTKASTPLKYPQCKLGVLFPSVSLDEVKRRTGETSPLNAIARNKIKLTLTELRHAVNEEMSP